MPNLVKKSHLQDVALSLWNKIQEKLDGVVRKWSDLEHVIEYPYANEMDYTQRIDGKWYPSESDGTEQENSHWSIYKHPVSPNDEYTLLRKYPDSGRIVFNDENNSVVEVQDLDRDVMTNGWYRQFITVPNNNAITHMGFCFQHGQNPSENLILIKEGNVRDAVDSIPYLDGAKITIGESVTTLFDNSGTSLNSQTINGAIKELNGEVSKSVKTWSDLDYANQYSIINLFNRRTIVDGQYYSGNGILLPNTDWCRFELPCQAGDMIKVAKKQHDSGNFMTLDENGHKLGNLAPGRVSVNGWVLYTVTIPNDIGNVAKVSVNIYKPHNPLDDNIMIFRGDVNPPVEYVPYLGGKEIVIDSDHVILSFNNNDTNLAAITVDDAIRELDGRTNTSSVGGVSMEEFTEHVTSNEQQYQTLASSISANTQNITTANQNISSQNQQISNLVNTTAKLNSQNTFTSKNKFMERSPIVDKYFSIKNIVENNGVDAPYDKYTYCCNPKQGIGSGVYISAILVPIHGSTPGDRIEAAYFVVNADSQRVVGDVPNTSTYTVQDIEYRGCYCIVFEVNRSFTHSVAFGFSVADTLYEGRRLRLLKQTANSNSWTSHLRLSNNEFLSHNDNTFLIPYAITQRSESEVVTRFDIENSTVPMNTYSLGELKMLVYDAGESTEIGGYTWLRCNGQTVSSDEYDELYDTIGSQFNTSSEDAIRQLNDDGTEVSVDFALPVNQSNVGYLYICAKQKGHSMSGL